MKEIIHKGDDFLSIEETVGSMVTTMGLVTMDNWNDNDTADKAICDFTIEIRRKRNERDD